LLPGSLARWEARSSDSFRTSIIKHSSRISLCPYNLYLPPLHPLVNIKIRQILHDLIPLLLSLDDLFIIEKHPRPIFLSNSSHVVSRMYGRSFVRDERFQSIVGGEFARPAILGGFRGRTGTGHLGVFPVIVRVTFQPGKRSIRVAVLSRRFWRVSCHDLQRSQVDTRNVPFLAAPSWPWQG
jgi:hypothetical protein